MIVSIVYKPIIRVTDTASLDVYTLSQHTLVALERNHLLPQLCIWVVHT